jgi:Tol biopolymer transport system component
LAFSENNPKTGSDIHILPLKGNGTAFPFLTTSADEGEASFSPDGRFLAYASNESGRYEVYVRPLSGGGGKSAISTGGGQWPRWSPKGDELFYLRGSTVMAVSVELEPAFRVGTPRPLFEGRYLTGWYRNYDITPDGKHFVMLTGEQAELTEMNVVLNWFEELKRLVPTGKNQ